MLLRRLTKYIKEQNWFALGLRGITGSDQNGTELSLLCKLSSLM
jgi:hypothetical protein